MTPPTAEAKPLHAERWAALPERGTPALLRLCGWIAIHLGRSVSRLLLYPITLYFVITGRKARAASREYLSRLTERRSRLSGVFRHFYCFAATILDRVYLLKGEFAQFDVQVHQREILHRQIESGRGCILLGSHIGSFEVLRAIGVTQQEFPLKVLMDIEHNEQITVFLDSLNQQIASTVIVPDRPDTLLRVKESLDSGYVIGILGDRPISDGKTTQCNFLGRSATFPAGPTLLAAMMHCPVILFFGIYRGSNRYDIYFEHFADEISLNRERRAEELQTWVQRYVQRLEHYALLAPYNWFNFYPFWD
ncbi:MAG: lipid A biosynthesis acyltransferase [Chthoniobacterales bacterium]